MARLQRREVALRGTDEASGALFSCVDLEERVPARHPLRLIRRIVNDAPARLDAGFDALYTDFARPSIAPERLIRHRQGIASQCPERRAGLVQILFSIRSERQLMEQMDDNLMVCWFVSLGIDDPAWGEGRAPGNLSSGQISALNGRSPGPKAHGVHEEPRPAA